jgi:hypothetical protein
MKKITRLFTLAMSSLLLLSLVSCGGESTKVVTGIDFSTRDGEQQEKLLNVDFELDLGESELPFAHYNLPNNYGALRLYTNAGVNHAAVDLNLTEILKLPEGYATLPNGQNVPVDTSAGIIEIPVDQINAKVYVAQAQGMTLVGFAMAIEQLDSIGREVGRTGVFPTFELESVDITAGIFTDEQAGGNGIAAFVNLGRLIGDLGDLLGEKVLAYNSSAFSYQTEYVTLRKQIKIYRAVTRQKAKKEVLTPALR